MTYVLRNRYTAQLHSLFRFDKRWQFDHKGKATKAISAIDTYSKVEFQVDNWRRCIRALRWNEMKRLNILLLNHEEVVNVLRK